MADQRPYETYNYDVFVINCRPIGFEAQEERERLAGLELSPAERQDLAQLDRILYEAAREGDVLDELLADDAGWPPEHWWWHLGAIRAGTFPADRLPAQLRELYPGGARGA